MLKVLNKFSFKFTKVIVLLNGEQRNLGLRGTVSLAYEYTELIIIISSTYDL